MPSVDVALRNAYASAFLKKPKAAIGWLDAAAREGLQNVSDVLLDKSFDTIRNDPVFERYVNRKK